MRHSDAGVWQCLRLVTAAWGLFVPALLVSAPADPAAAPEPRVALVIGNAAYSRPGEKLANPCRDARAVAQMLRGRLGFEVIEACDLDRLEIHRKVDEFAGRVQPQGVALFYYSGHGVEVDGQNYLLPIGHNARARADVEVMGYPLFRVIAEMEARGGKLNLVLLDACRDNPLPAGTKGGTKGLARVDSRPGTIVAFATRAGATAEDGAGLHSPYAQAILEVLPQRGLSVTEALNEVGLRTRAATGQRQEPWWSQSAVPRVYLAGTSAALPESAVTGGVGGTLRVVTTPLHARIYLNEKYVGDSPVDLKDLPAGTIDVIARLEGYEDSRERVLIQAGRRVELPLELTGLVTQCSLYVEVDPVVPGTEVLVDGRPYLAGMSVAGGEDHQIEVTAPGHEKTTQTVRALGAEERVTIRMAEESSAREPGSLFGPMVVIAGGEFQMGGANGASAEWPVHTVNVKPFRLGKFEVTVAQFRAFTSATGFTTEAERRVQVGSLTGCEVRNLKAHGGTTNYRNMKSWRDPGFTQTDDRPVVCVSWNDALAYIDWLTRKTGRRFRLPSETEWEYAAREGVASIQRTANLCQFANGADRTPGPSGEERAVPRLECADGFYYTAPVGSYATDGYGLHDTLGNVEEWVADCWHPDYRGTPAHGAARVDARASCENESRVARGGSWLSTAEGLTASARHVLHRSARTQMTGFRLAEDLDGQ